MGMKKTFTAFILLAFLANNAEPSDEALIPAGEFLMGTDQGTPAERPIHKVELGGFFLDRFEVSNQNYEAFDPGFHRSSASSCDRCPATRVSWYEAQAYCQSLNRRLPSEAEWEKARRGPAENPSASRPQETARTSLPIKAGAFAVDSPPANGYGIHHLAGNVWEWVNDWHDESYYRTSPAENPLGPLKGLRKSVRGGSWYNNVWYTQPGMRFQLAPHVKLNSLGFRCARSANGSNN
jgi:formylglycine-generating enzyme required for sulfatase activity|tara:strand:- start:1396 stop:2106 length:711 start_codon:yes stop_codon:yes gene_type:complete